MSGAGAFAAMKLMIEKLRRELYGQPSERKQRLLDQTELQLDKLEAGATEDEPAAAGTMQLKAFTRRRPVRKPFCSAMRNFSFFVDFIDGTGLNRSS